jgi:hypothetical protein
MELSGDLLSEHLPLQLAMVWLAAPQLAAVRLASLHWAVEITCHLSRVQRQVVLTYLVMPLRVPRTWTTYGWTNYVLALVKNDALSKDKRTMAAGT